MSGGGKSSQKSTTTTTTTTETANVQGIEGTAAVVSGGSTLNVTDGGIVEDSLAAAVRIANESLDTVVEGVDTVGDVFAAALDFGGDALDAVAQTAADSITAQNSAIRSDSAETTEKAIKYLAIAGGVIGVAYYLRK
ncbi:MAG: hypothetical protein V6Z82_07010 [Flavobacteriales bacterium]